MIQTTLFDLSDDIQIYSETNKDKIILDLCGGTGAWSRPYKQAGYDVRVITLPDDDVCKYNPPKKVYGILAAPPCTMFSIARNDKTAKSPRDLRQGMKIVNACLRIIHECIFDDFRVDEGLRFWAMENPATGYLKRFLGKPALIFDPCDYGDPYTKKTALWGVFNEPVKNKIIPRDISNEFHIKDHNCFTSRPSSFKDLKPIPEGYKEKTGYENQTIIRSITPEHFAIAFYKANQ